MALKKKNKRMYFDQDVEDAIIEYNLETDPGIRNELYQDRIAYAFDKLAENIINTFKFSYFDAPFIDVKQEVVSFLVLNIHKYDHTKGFKAFSYFSVVAKNYLILVNNSNYKKTKIQYDLDATSTIKELIKTHPQNDEMSHYSTDFMNELIDYFNSTIPKIFTKKRDANIAFALMDLFTERGMIENYNKKSIYLLLREMTGCETIRITKVVNTLKTYYGSLANEFNTKGTLTHLQGISSNFNLHWKSRSPLKTKK